MLARMETVILPRSDHVREVGRRLRLLIEAIGITQAEAARDMGVPPNHLGNWIRGDRSYPLEYSIYRFCRIRGVDTNWLYLGDPSSLPERVARRLLNLEPAPEPEAPLVKARRADENVQVSAASAIALTKKKSLKNGSIKATQ
jgi:transcriptional regulator with XRE-family HTH domain